MRPRSGSLSFAMTFIHLFEVWLMANHPLYLDVPSPESPHCGPQNLFSRGSRMMLALRLMRFQRGHMTSAGVGGSPGWIDDPREPAANGLRSWRPSPEQATDRQQSCPSPSDVLLVRLSRIHLRSPANCCPPLRTRVSQKCLLAVLLAKRETRRSTPKNSRHDPSALPIRSGIVMPLGDLLGSAIWTVPTLLPLSRNVFKNNFPSSSLLFSPPPSLDTLFTPGRHEVPPNLRSSRRSLCLRRGCNPARPRPSFQPQEHRPPWEHQHSPVQATPRSYPLRIPNCSDSYYCNNPRPTAPPTATMTHPRRTSLRRMSPRRMILRRMTLRRTTPRTTLPLTRPVSSRFRMIGADLTVPPVRPLSASPRIYVQLSTLNRTGHPHHWSQWGP